MRGTHPTASQRQSSRRGTPAVAAIAALSVAAAMTGCATPSHTARFGLNAGESMLIRPEGESPTVKVAPHFSPLKRVAWFHDDENTLFTGVAVGGSLQLTLKPGDSLCITSESGSQVNLTLWNATGYTLENCPTPTDLAKR